MPRRFRFRPLLHLLISIICLRVKYLGESLVATVREQLADEKRRQQRPRRRHPARAAAALATRRNTYPDTTGARPLPPAQSEQRTSLSYNSVHAPQCSSFVCLTSTFVTVTPVYTQLNLSSLFVSAF